ncbi:MAG: glycerol-3-phosphate 1-O-acyltransferase PlsY [Tissierellia bacterium]|nr:glycerol-3-phosphate 1-O-acyltransferase PlsY [Tissierellia bacterium]
MRIFISLLVGYSLGAIPIAYIIGKVQKGIDLREHGSGNLGATNVLRNLGLVSFIICAAFDILKSYLAFRLIGNFFGDNLGILAGFAAVLGHCYSPFMNFKGGKGVATSGGLILAFDIRLLIVSALILLIVLLITRRMSLASISVALAFPFIYYYFLGFDNLFFGAILLAGFVIFKHKDNIKRLLKGEEPKLF